MTIQPSERTRIRNLLDYQRRQLKFLESLPASPVTESAIQSVRVEMAKLEAQLQKTPMPKQGDTKQPESNQQQQSSQQ